MPERTLKSRSRFVKLPRKYNIFIEKRRLWPSVTNPQAATAEFAVASIRRYHLLIEADAGGCNGPRPSLWKREPQRLANDTGLSITVCHSPSGASKWNPIEHRLFRKCPFSTSRLQPDGTAQVGKQLMDAFLAVGFLLRNDQFTEQVKDLAIGCGYGLRRHHCQGLAAV